MEVDGSQSVTAWGINVGSKLAQGVSKIYSNIFSTTRWLQITYYYIKVCANVAQMYKDGYITVHIFNLNVV